MDSENGDSDDQIVEVPGKIHFLDKIHDVNVRRTVLEFGRCFLSGSIAAGCLRGVDSIPVALKLSQALKSFSTCIHAQQGICYACRGNLLQVGNSAEEILSPEGRAACAISSAAFSGEVEVPKKTVGVVGKVIEESLAIRERYHHFFERYQTDNVRIYNKKSQGQYWTWGLRR